MQLLPNRVDWIYQEVYDTFSQDVGICTASAAAASDIWLSITLLPAAESDGQCKTLVEWSHSFDLTGNCNGTSGTIPSGVASSGLYTRSEKMNESSPTCVADV